MKDLNKTIEKTRKNYREIFVQSLEAIQERIDAIKPDGVVTDIFETYPENSEGRKWQTAVLDMLLNDISKEILEKWTKVLAYRKEFNKSTRKTKLLEICKIILCFGFAGLFIFAMFVS